MRVATFSFSVMSSFLEAIQPVTPALPSACSNQPKLLYLLPKLFPIAYLLQVTLCSCQPLISCFLCYKSYFAPYINIGLKLTRNIFSFFVDTFRGLVTGRKGAVPYCMAHAITLIVVFFPTTSFKRYLTKYFKVQNRERT
jgi:hypothetical protein